MSKTRMTRQELLSYGLMGAGVALSYGLLSLQGLAFLLPRRLRPKTRRIFAGAASQFKVGGVQEYRDPSGGTILVKRSAEGFEAFSSVCPHLGCRVRWEADKNRFLCPCHNGIFDADGKGVTGPPAAAGQKLARVPLVYDKESGIVYIEVRDTSGRKRA